MTASGHILVVDDELSIRKLIETYLNQQGYKVTTARSGAAMRRTLAEYPVDLVILDLVMPGEDGLDLTRYLRQTTNVGIIILTGLGDVVDRVVGLEIGADDYLAKPFDLRELLARVRSVLRRAAAGDAPKAETRMARFAGWTLDLATRRLVSPEGRDTLLTTAEYALLAAFVNNPNRVLNRETLLDLTHSAGPEPFDRSIDVLVYRLRRKIEPDPKQPVLVKTVRGGGYMFTPTPETNS